jgi:hypothetical protein
VQAQRSITTQATRQGGNEYASKNKTMNIALLLLGSFAFPFLVVIILGLYAAKHIDKDKKNGK